jgi:hypothetical protein
MLIEQTGSFENSLQIGTVFPNYSKKKSKLFRKIGEKRKLEKLLGKKCFGLIRLLRRRHRRVCDGIAARYQHLRPPLLLSLVRPCHRVAAHHQHIRMAAANHAACGATASVLSVVVHWHGHGIDASNHHHRWVWVCFGGWPFLGCLLFTFRVLVVLHLYSGSISCTLFDQNRITSIIFLYKFRHM